eukprot:Lithocolla_globosa_v1_NODE_1515_length_2519_cov_63.243101.p2 type:complete len:162 gc:universal NODE_1515_length_2519_cov_63.243101:1374-889(-)
MATFPSDSYNEFVAQIAHNVGMSVELFRFGHFFFVLDFITGLFFGLFFSGWCFQLFLLLLLRTNEGAGKISNAGGNLLGKSLQDLIGFTVVNGTNRSFNNVVDGSCHNICQVGDGALQLTALAVLTPTRSLFLGLSFHRTGSRNGGSRVRNRCSWLKNRCS